MHICQDEIAAAIAAMPLIGYCLACAKKFFANLRRKK